MTPAQLNNNKDLEVVMNKGKPSFFGSFFSSAKGQQQKAKKGPQEMEAASIFYFNRNVMCLYFMHSHRQSSVHMPL